MDCKINPDTTLDKINYYIIGASSRGNGRRPYIAATLHHSSLRHTYTGRRMHMFSVWVRVSAMYFAHLLLGSVKLLQLNPETVIF